MKELDLGIIIQNKRIEKYTDEALVLLKLLVMIRDTLLERQIIKSNQDYFQYSFKEVTNLLNINRYFQIKYLYQLQSFGEIIIQTEQQSKKLYLSLI